MMGHDTELRRELRRYLIGFALALILTVVPFALVAWGALSFGTALSVIGISAILQGVVQLRFFLDIDLSTQKRKDLHLILFTVLLLSIMAAGTIWIMASLANRMIA